MFISYYVQEIIIGVLLMLFSFILIANNFQVRNLLGFVMGVTNQIILPFEFPTNREINTKVIEESNVLIMVESEQKQR